MSDIKPNDITHALVDAFNEIADKQPTMTRATAYLGVAMFLSAMAKTHARNENEYDQNIFKVLDALALMHPSALPQHVVRFGEHGVTITPVLDTKSSTAH